MELRPDSLPGDKADSSWAIIGIGPDAEKAVAGKGLQNSTIRGAPERMRESYYRQMHFQVIANIAAGSQAGDSSDF